MNDDTFFVSVLWEGWWDTENAPVSYGFKTKAELDAFLDGVYEANGWMGCEFVIHTEGENQKFTPEDFEVDPDSMSTRHKEEWKTYLGEEYKSLGQSSFLDH